MELFVFGRKSLHFSSTGYFLHAPIFVQYENSAARDECEVWSRLCVSSDETASSNTRIQSELELNGR